MEYVIFLNLDGVIVIYDKNVEAFIFNYESIKVLKNLIQMYNAKVVMITSWQSDGNEISRKKIKKTLEEFGIYDIDFIDPNFKGNLCFENNTVSLKINSRLLGIVNHFQKQSVCNYVILDDEYSNDYKLLGLNHYKTEMRVGLTKEDLSKITFKPVNYNDFKYINFENKDLKQYEKATNGSIKVLKRKYGNHIN